MLQLRGLQNDSKHEELQRLREETLLQCVSCPQVVILCMSVSMSHVFTLKWFIMHPKTAAVFNLSSDGNRTLQMCVCNHVATQLRPLYPSSAVYQWLFQPPPLERGPICGVGKCLPPPPPWGKGEVSTKEIPKVPLQWHGQKHWKLACPLTPLHSH